MRLPTDRTGWRSIFEWAIALGMLALTLIGAASIGVFVAPFAIVGMGVAVRRNLMVWLCLSISALGR